MNFSWEGKVLTQDSRRLKCVAVNLLFWRSQKPDSVLSPSPQNRFIMVCCCTLL